MSNEGWIKLYRKITDHWVWENQQYLHAWLTILVTANYEPKDTIIQGEKIHCERGQSILSLQSWTVLFGREWTVQKTRTFFDLLKKDGMITTEGLHKTTRLTICKYEDYQSEQQADNMPKEQQADNMQKEQKTTRLNCKISDSCEGGQQANNKQKEEKITTTKEDKKLRREEIEEKRHAAFAATSLRRDEFYKSLIPFVATYGKAIVKDFYNYWIETNKSGTKMKFELQATWDTNLRIQTWSRKELIFNSRSKGSRDTTPKTTIIPELGHDGQPIKIAQ